MRDRSYASLRINNANGGNAAAFISFINTETSLSIRVHRPRFFITWKYRVSPEQFLFLFPFFPKIVNNLACVRGSVESIAFSEEEILQKNLTSHQFPERARVHQLHGISTVSHFLNVGQMCRDVRRRTVEGADPKTWYGRVVTSVGRRGRSSVGRLRGRGEGAGR